MTEDIRVIDGVSEVSLDQLLQSRFKNGDGVLIMTEAATDESLSSILRQAAAWADGAAFKITQSMLNKVDEFANGTSFSATQPEQPQTDTQQVDSEVDKLCMISRLNVDLACDDKHIAECLRLSMKASKGLPFLVTCFHS